MDFQEKDKKRYPLLKSFSFACQGILEAVRTERNIKIHFALTAIVVFFGWYFSLNGMEWLFILAAIAGTITLELVNSAIERVVDLITDQIHPLAKQAKDIAAGAVFIYAIFSIIVGLIIFLPKFGL